MWWEGNTCNMHLDKLAAHVKEGVQAAGLVGLRFNTIGVSDGISMGTDGMSYSLPSRDLIADSIETVVGAQWHRRGHHDSRLRQEHARVGDGDVPAQSAFDHGVRRNDPSRLRPGKPRDVISAFQSYGEYLAGVITDQQRLDIVTHACPGAGACGGMHTANTMATAIGALGLSLPQLVDTR